MKILLSALLVLFAAAATLAQTNSKDDAALKALVKQMTDAQISFDAATLDKIFTSDFIEISPLGEVDSRDRVLSFYKPERKPSGDFSGTTEVSEVSIRTYGKFAIVIAKLAFTMTRANKTGPPNLMRATLVCRNEKDAWKIASAQYTSIRAPLQPPPPKS